MVEAEGSKLKVIAKEAETDIRAIATHPKMYVLFFLIKLYIIKRKIPIK